MGIVVKLSSLQNKEIGAKFKIIGKFSTKWLNLLLQRAHWRNWIGSWKSKYMYIFGKSFNLDRAPVSDGGYSIGKRSSAGVTKFPTSSNEELNHHGTKMILIGVWPDSVQILPKSSRICRKSGHSEILVDFLFNFPVRQRLLENPVFTLDAIRQSVVGLAISNPWLEILLVDERSEEILLVRITNTNNGLLACHTY